jgi:hypothetical protein
VRNKQSRKAAKEEIILKRTGEKQNENKPCFFTVRENVEGSCVSAKKKGGNFVDLVKNTCV